MRNTHVPRKQQKSFWKSPLFVVCVTATLVLSVKMIGYMRSDSIDPRVLIETDTTRTSASKRAESGIVTPVAFDSAAIRRADRGREAAALILAAGLWVTNETLEGRIPQTWESVISGLAGKGLLPPGVTTRSLSGLGSEHSTIYLRYRPITSTLTFGMEVISIGRSPSDGPAMLIQLSPAKKEQALSFYQSPQSEDLTIPQPFASDSDIIGAGWLKESIEPK